MCFSSGKKAAKKQAAATLKAAEMQAAADRENARGNTLAMITQLAQARASEQASELLNVPQESASVVLSTDADEPEIDETTRRRKTTRSQFFSGSSGISI